MPKVAYMLTQRSFGMVSACCGMKIQSAKCWSHRRFATPIFAVNCRESNFCCGIWCVRVSCSTVFVNWNIVGKKSKLNKHMMAPLGLLLKNLIYFKNVTVKYISTRMKEINFENFFFFELMRNKLPISPMWIRILIIFFFLSWWKFPFHHSTTHWSASELNRLVMSFEFAK